MTRTTAWIVALVFAAAASCTFSTEKCDVRQELICDRPSGPECHVAGGRWYIRECSGYEGCMSWETIEVCGDSQVCETTFWPAECVCDRGPKSCYYEYLDHGLWEFSECFSSEEIRSCRLSEDGCPMWTTTSCESPKRCVEDETGFHCAPPVDCNDLCPEGTFGRCAEVGEKTCDFSDEKKTILICQQHPTSEECACWVEFRDCGDSRCLWTWSNLEYRYVPYCE